MPSQSDDAGLSRVERGQDDVHVRERRRPTGRRRPAASATRRRPGSRRARRTGTGSARGPASGRRRRQAPGPRARPGSSSGPAGGRPATRRADDRSRAAAPRRRRRPGSPPNDATPSIGSLSFGDRPGGVADPERRVREADARSAGDERPRVEGIDGEVRVAAGGAAICVEQAGRDERRLGLSSMTDSPNGRHSSDRRQKPARPVVRIRIGARSGAPRRGSGRAGRRRGGRRPRRPPSGSAAGQSARRIVTTATIGIRIPSCGLISAATTAQIAARSGRSRHSSRRPSRRKTTPTESTWPQTTLSNQLIGLTTATNGAEQGQPLAGRRARGPSTRRASRWRGRRGSAGP